MCSRSLEDAEFHLDHIIPRSAFGGDDPPNLQCCCVHCHEMKTNEETQSLGIEDSFPLLSRFSLETYQAFIESAKPPQCVCNLNKPKPGDPLEIGVVRCRFNAYMTNVHPLCIFSPIDEIRPAIEGELGDFNWIDVGTPRSLRKALPGRQLP